MALESRLTSRGRILKNTTELVTVVVYDDGTAEAPSAGTPTYTITDANGASVQSGSVTVNGTTLEISLAAQTAVKKLTITISGTWNGAAQSFSHELEVVGGHLFTENQARSFYVGGATPLSDTSLYSDADIATARDQITDDLEFHTGVSWVPRYGRFETAGEGKRDLWLPHHQINSVISCTISGTAQTVANLKVWATQGKLSHSTGTFSTATLSNPENVVVEYEHGYKGLPYGVQRVALLLLMSRVVKGDVPSRATAVESDIGLVRLAGYKPFGIPEVDEWIADHDERPVSI